MVIALIGGVGSGKSTVCDMIAANGFTVLKADDTAKELMTPGHSCYDRLVEAFGPAILGSDGSIDKTAYAELIYENAAAREKSDSIVHPAVVEYLRESIAGSESGNVVLEAALPTPEFLELADEVWYVYADIDVRIKRLSESRGYTEEHCRRVIASQLDEASFTILADHIVDNSGSEEETKARIGELLAAPAE